MRLAVIAPPWLPVPPPAYGGTESVIDRLARGVADRGHEVELFTTGDSTCPVTRRWTFPQAQRHRLGDAVAELRHALAAYDEAERFDVIHDHTVVGPVLAADRSHSHVVTTNHRPFDDDLLSVYRRISGRVPVIAISQHQASTATGVEVARVIHHGIDVERFPVGDGDGGYLLFLGRMHPDKGAHRAIEVARATGMRLRLAGKRHDAEERRFVEEFIVPQLGGGIDYLGEVDDAEKISLLRGAAALLNPIRWPEPFGLVMIEALACGTPVFTFAEGAAPEIVEDGITGCIARDEDDLIEAVRSLDRFDRGLCRKSAETRFSTQRMVDEHIELYEALRAR
jgi:glycosyltransferase involved in cell wall biosynthesis